MRISDWSSDVCSSDLRLVATFLPGLAVQRDRVAFTLGLLQRLQRANVGFRFEAAQLGEKAARAEHEHAAVPVVITLFDELLRTINGRFLDKTVDFLCSAGAKPRVRFHLQSGWASCRERVCT